MQGKDLSGIHIEGHIKIHDPETKEIFINKRCDGNIAVPVKVIKRDLAEDTKNA